MPSGERHQTKDPLAQPGGAIEIPLPKRVADVIKLVRIVERQIRRPVPFVLRQIDTNLGEQIAFAHEPRQHSSLSTQHSYSPRPTAGTMIRSSSIRRVN